MYVTFALLLSSLSTDMIDGGTWQSEETAIHEQHGNLRRLADDKTSGSSSNISIPNPHIEIPCMGKFIKPCGNITIPKDGITIKHPFGSVHIPGSSVLKPYVHKLDLAFSHYTAYFTGILAAVYAFINVVIPSRRNKIIKNAKKTFKGDLEDSDSEEEEVTEEQKQAELKKRLDPESADFIAPGNIYRVLAVLHPGKIGWHSWASYAMKAGICAYMQVYLPFKFSTRVLIEWRLVGIKSPIWFTENAVHFASMFAALGSLCDVFRGKCAASIKDGCEANFYILTHKEPEGSGDAQTQSSSGGYTSLLSKPKLPPMAINANQYFWCCLSLAMNMTMSFMLFLTMFLKVATFVGKMQDIAIVAMSLYFIFDLDDKVMQSDPKLKKMYRRAVVKQTVECEYKPLWLNTMVGLQIGLMKLLTPVGLLLIILLAWKNRATGHVIGGSGI